jgi:hypothetical protein
MMKVTVLNHSGFFTTSLVKKNIPKSAKTNIYRTRMKKSREMTICILGWKRNRGVSARKGKNKEKIKNMKKCPPKN